MATPPDDETRDVTPDPDATATAAGPAGSHAPRDGPGRTPTDEEAPGPVRLEPAPPLGRSAGASRYTLLGEIARGGMGAVLKGHDAELGRELAVKVLLDRHLGRPEVVRRFVEEAQIGGQLQHPGVVPVYDLGTLPDARPFFAMKLVRGRTLAELLAERSPGGRVQPAETASDGGLHPPDNDDLPRFLAIFEAACQAIAYAHAHGVIHRDLKPANVMVGAFGEVQVMDWGLAKILRGDVPADPGREVVHTLRSEGGYDVSQSGVVLGTPAYMAPEQARGEVDRVDERADVFALGAILCTILTDRPPFSGSNASEVLGRAQRCDAAGALGRLDACGSDAELIALARDCLAAEPDDRPADAGVVATRVTAYQAGVRERLRAAEIARVEALARAEEEAKRAKVERDRRRLTVGLAASVLGLFGLGGGTAFWVHQQRQARLSGLEHALVGVQALRDRAATTADPAAWREAAAAAEQAIASAADLAGTDPGRRLAALRETIAAEVEAADRDRTLLGDLTATRTALQDLGESGVNSGYADAFRRYGLDPDATPVAEAAARLEARPAAFRAELVAMLDDWTSIRRRLGIVPARPGAVVALARALDPDPERDRFRALLAESDLTPHRDDLRGLSDAPHRAGLAAPTALLLARALTEAGDGEAALEVLSDAAARHPGDLWANYDLATALDDTRPRRVEDVIRHYAVARALRPETGHVLAHMLERSGRGAEAEAVFRDLTARRPEDARYLTCLGEHLQDRGRGTEAASVLDLAIAAGRDALRLDPNDAAAHMTHGLSLFLRGKLDEAVAAYREAIRLRPTLIQAHMNLGNALVVLGSPAEAIATYRETIRLAPDWAPAHTNLGTALKDAGKPDEAIAALREAIRLDPDLARAHYNLGVVLESQRKVDEAIAAYREAIRLKPDHAPSHANLGTALRAQGKPDEAVAAWREAIRLWPGQAPLYYGLGVALQSLGKADEAVAAHREAIRLQPDYAEAHTNLGIALRAQGKPDEAVAAHREAIRLQPDYADAHSNLGNALKDQGKQDEAMAEYREAIRLQPDHADAHYNLGVVLESQRKVDEAIAAYREAIRLRPDHAEAYNNLGIALYDRGKPDEAVAAWREAIRLRPDHAPAYYNLGRALLSQGRPDEAITEFREAVRLKPDHAESRHNLGLALASEGKREEAVAEFRRAAEVAAPGSPVARDIPVLIRGIEQQIRLAARLPAILKGEDRPTDNDERLALAQISYDTKRFAASAKFWAEALEADTKLADDRRAQHRYNAACAAALAAAGQGVDDPAPDAAAKAKLRAQALAWLKAERAAWSDILASDGPKLRAAVAPILRHWKQDPDLAGVRDPDVLAKLPVEEREAWRALWAEVDTVLNQAQGP
jgi:serine/threonine-protein kinase